MFSKKKKSTKLAIAVRDDSILAVELMCGEGHKAHLTAWSAVSLMNGIVQSGKLIKPRLFEKAVLELLQHPDHGDFTQSACHLVLPEALIRHHIAVVKTPNAEFSESIFNEAMLNVIHKQQTEERFMHGEMNKDQDKWTHASYSFKKDDYKQYEKAFTEVGLSIQDCSSSGQAASAFYFLGAKAAEPLLWMHIGEKQTEYALMDSHGIYKSDAINLGVADLQKRLQVQTGLARDRVEAILHHWGKRRHMNGYDEITHTQMEDWLHELLKPAKQLLTLSKIHHDEHLALLLCGQGSLIPEVGESCSQELEIPLRVTRSWLKISPLLEIKTYHQYVPALGAALQ